MPTHVHKTRIHMHMHMHSHTSKRPDQPFSAPQRPSRYATIPTMYVHTCDLILMSSYRSSLPQHASNPPKHRMGMARTAVPSGGMAVSGHVTQAAGKPPAQKGKEEVVVMRSGKGNVGGITTLQPPPPSKAKGRVSPTPSPTPTSSVSQAQVQSGGTTYFYSGQQVRSVKMKSPSVGVDVFSLWLKEMV